MEESGRDVAVYIRREKRGKCMGYPRCGALSDGLSAQECGCVWQEVPLPFLAGAAIANTPLLPASERLTRG